MEYHFYDGCHAYHNHATHKRTEEAFLHNSSWMADAGHGDSVILGTTLAEEASPYPHVSPDYSGLGIIGILGSETAFWQQQHNATSTVISQEFILESLGLYLSEHGPSLEAMHYGWYTPSGGALDSCVGGLLELHGMSVYHV